MKFQSLCVREHEDTEFNPPHIQAVYLSSSYKFESLQDGMDVFSNAKDGDVYSRYGHPNHRSLAQKLSHLESSEKTSEVAVLLTNSGMSAIHTLLTTLLEKGDKILSANDLYGGTSDLMNHNLKRYGIQTHYHDLKDAGVLEEQLKKLGPKLVYLESPSNPLLQCYDISKISEACHEYGAKLVIDNTFCTPYVQRPLDLGADFVLYSTTKYLNGHGNALGGAIAGTDKEFIHGPLLKSMRLNGSTISPFEAWLLGQGIKTLSLRMDKQQQNAMAIANFLERNGKVRRVYYPGLKSHETHDIARKQMKGFGAMVSFELKEDPYRFMKGLELITLAPTLGDVHSLVLHPSSMSHRNMDDSLKEKLGISQNLIRLSVGIEDAEDLMNDLESAL